MKPHIRRVWWDPACCYMWQMEIHLIDGTIGSMQRHDLYDFSPTVSPEMHEIYKVAQSVRTH